MIKGQKFHGINAVYCKLPIVVVMITRCMHSQIEAFRGDEWVYPAVLAQYVLMFNKSEVFIHG